MIETEFENILELMYDRILTILLALCGGLYHWLRNNLPYYEAEMILYDIELRFIERPVVEMIDATTGTTRIVKILQSRKFTEDGWENRYWTDWQDIPLEAEEK